jgi:hypothetical protein
VTLHLKFSALTTKLDGTHDETRVWQICPVLNASRWSCSVTVGSFPAVDIRGMEKKQMGTVAIYATTWALIGEDGVESELDASRILQELAKLLRRPRPQP